MGHETLARSSEDSAPDPAFLSTLEDWLGKTYSGTRLIEETDGKRLVSWQRSTLWPDVYATASEARNAALAQWRTRSYAIGAAGLLLGLASSAVLGLAAQFAHARHQSQVNELAVREVHHRVMNSLQLVNSLIQLRLKSEQDPRTVGIVRDVMAQIGAIADAHRLLQTSPSLQEADVSVLIRNLCRHIPHLPGIELRCSEKRCRVIDASHATTLAVATNEMITNSLKHARSLVSVTCREADGELLIEVENDGEKLSTSDNGDCQQGTGFGLRTIRALARGIGGDIAVMNSPNGVVSSLHAPLEKLVIRS
jgi:two-component sensor histidine kinase